MTSMERKRLQMQLSILQRRKAKADELGTEAIKRSQGLYDTICADIERTEKTLLASDGGIVADLLGLMKRIIDMQWSPGAFDFGLGIFDGGGRLMELETDLIAAYHMGREDKYRAALTAYEKVIAQINEASIRRNGEQIKIDGFTEIYDDENPFA